MRLFDLHCDTPVRMFRLRDTLSSPYLQFSTRDVAAYHSYTQVMAFWCDARADDENAWLQFHRIKTWAEACRPSFPESLSVIYAVEDARLLAGSLARLEILWEMGIRILTLCWAGASCIGGAWDTDLPLTDFGRAVVEGCFALGMVVDVSHSSAAVTDEVLRMAEAAHIPVIASHSNFAEVCPHGRNLSAGQFRHLTELGGLCGISLCPHHLTPDGDAGIDDVMRMLTWGYEHGGENTLAFGCDFDGITRTPRQLRHPRELLKLCTPLQVAGISAPLQHRLFYQNADCFFAKHNVLPRNEF